MSAAGAAGAAGASAAGATAAAIAQAIKASGAIVQIEPEDFLSLLGRTEGALVVTAAGGFFSDPSSRILPSFLARWIQKVLPRIQQANYKYLTAYKGLIFFTKAEKPLDLPNDIELIAAKKIWIPA